MVLGNWALLLLGVSVAGGQVGTGEKGGGVGVGRGGRTRWPPDPSSLSRYAAEAADMSRKTAVTADIPNARFRPQSILIALLLRC